MYRHLALIFEENAFDFSFYHVFEIMKDKMRNRNKQFRISLYRQRQKERCSFFQISSTTDCVKDRQISNRKIKETERKLFFRFFLFHLIFRCLFRINLRIVHSLYYKVEPSLLRPAFNTSSESNHFPRVANPRTKFQTTFSKRLLHYESLCVCYPENFSQGKHIFPRLLGISDEICLSHTISTFIYITIPIYLC